MLINKYFWITVIAFSFSALPLSAQKKLKTGLYYTTIAKKLEGKAKLDTSRLYYDSAFHAYTKQKQFVSATQAFKSFEKSLLDSGQVDSAHYYMRTVYNGTKKMRQYDFHTDILTLKKSLAQYYFNKNKFDSTAIVLKTTLQPSIKAFGKTASQNTSLYTMQSLLDFYKGDLRSASTWMKTALDANRDKAAMGEMWIEYIEYNLLMENEKALGDLSTSKKEFAEKKTINAMYSALLTYNAGEIEKAVSEFSAIEFAPDSSTSQAVVLKYNLLKSMLLLEKGEYDESLDIAKKYLSLTQSTYPEAHPIAAGYYEQICRVYMEKSDFGAARSFIEKLVNGMEAELGPRHPSKASAYFEYSRLLSSLENFAQSKNQIDSAINISRKHHKKEGIFLGRAYNQKGVVNFHLNKLDTAEIYLKQSMGILDKNLSNKQHIYIAKVFNDLGRVYQFKEIDSNSIRDYIRSLKIYKKLLGNVHPHLGVGYYNVGSLYDKNKDYAMALSNYQTSLNSNVFDFQDTSILVNPKLDNVLSDFILLRTLTGKVEALENYYGVTKDIQHLTSALETYNLISDLVDKLRKGYVSNESKKFLSEKTSYLYERAIKLCVRLNKLTDDKKYLERAFFFSERSRAGIMLSSIKDANAKKVAGVPDELLEKEKVVVQKIAAKEIEVFDEMNKGAKARPATVKKLQGELFNLKNDYTNFISLLEKDYNSYFKLKYDNYSATVSDIQSTILTPIGKKDKKKYTLLEYFIGKDSLYVFEISKEKYVMHVKKKPGDFERMIKGLRNNIIYNVNENFTELSTRLYDLLIPSTIEKKMHFIIVPDGILSYLPFESLLAVATDKPLRKQKYLINRASISYSYSATLSVEMAKVPYDYEANATSFTGFAPVFSDMDRFKVLSNDKKNEVAYTRATSNVRTIDKNFAALQGSEEELENIFKKVKGRNFETNAYFYNSASKQNLLKPSTLNSRFLHFATHGILDERNPDFSGIVFTDSSGSDVLTLGEIYGFSTKTEMVTLSACETGLGQLQGGEGLVSFSRGFFFAGAKFIVVSLWKVGDESTAEVMTKFYSRYGKKKRKDI
jgi:CHAT domain-containing protein